MKNMTELEMIKEFLRWKQYNVLPVWRMEIKNRKNLDSFFEDQGFDGDAENATAALLADEENETEQG